MVQIGASQTPSSNITLKMSCYGAATVLCAVTVMANLNFGLSLGSKAAEKIVYSIASVAADIVKLTAVIVVIRLWQKRQRMLACVGAVFGIMCLSWSLASAPGSRFRLANTPPLCMRRRAISSRVGRRQFA